MKVGEIVEINYKKYRVVSNSSGDGLTIEPIEEEKVEEFFTQPEPIEKRLERLEEKIDNIDNIASIVKMIYKYI